MLKPIQIQEHGLPLSYRDCWRAVCADFRHLFLTPYGGGDSGLLLRNLFKLRYWGNPIIELFPIYTKYGNLIQAS